MKTKKNIILAIALLLCTSAFAQSAAQAKTVLDKVASVVGRRGGASANFTISGGGYGTTSGKLAIKGSKFKAVTPQATVWFDGRTQWSYMKSTNEVNVSTPTEAQRMAMNPYSFITMYKSGYTMSMQKAGATYNITLKATNRSRSVQQLYIKVAKNYQPTQIKMLQGGKWTTISIRNFRAVNQSDNTFRFKQSDAPSAEVIDLR